MKKNIKTSALLGVCGAIVLGLTQSGLGQDQGFYIKGDAGGNWTKDLELREFFGVPLAPDSKVRLDPGVRLGFAGGYQFTDWFALEGEVGLFYNQIDSVTGSSNLHDARFGNAPLLFNVKLQWPTRCPFSPYIGAGVGFSETFFDIDHMEIGNVSLHGSAADTVFAWQAFAGVRYTLNQSLAFCVEYRFFDADPASWEAESSLGTSTISFGRTESQSVSVAVIYRF